MRLLQARAITAVLIAGPIAACEIVFPNRVVPDDSGAETGSFDGASEEGTGAPDVAQGDRSADANEASDQSTGPDGTGPVDSRADTAEAMDGPPPPPILFSQVNFGTGATVAFNELVAAHDAIVVVGLDLANTPQPIVTDTLGSHFQLVLPPTADGFGAAVFVAVALDTAFGSDAVTVSFNSPGVDSSDFARDLYIAEYSGLAYSSAFDVGTIGAMGCTPSASSTPATTTRSNELIVGFIDPQGPDQMDAGPGFTTRYTSLGNLYEDKVVAAPGTYAATATNSTQCWMALIAAFKGQ